MFNGKYISSEEIIRRVIRDSGIEGEIPWSDMLEWVVEVLDLIAAPKTWVNTLEIVSVADFKAKLPCGYKNMIQASGSFNGKSWFPMNYSTNTFHPTKQFPQLNNSNIVPNAVNNISRLALWNENNQSNGNPLYNINAHELYSVPGFLFEIIPGYTKQPATYKLGEDYIFTNQGFKDGYILMAFQKYPFDCNGYPLVPDNEKVKQAVKWYLQSKLDYKAWRMGQISDKVYSKTEQEYMWYVGAAQSSMLMPNLDEMESWKNMLRKFIVPDTAHHTGFTTSSKR
jgi:hypothetical protein